MEKQEFKSKWDELAREIGAEIPPETEQREQIVPIIADTVSSQPSRATHVPATVRPPLPKKQAVDWNSLAGELGLPPVETTTPAVEVEQPPKPQQRQPAERQARGPKPPRRDDRESVPRRESTAQRPEAGEKRHERRDRHGRHQRPDNREAPQRRPSPRDMSPDDVARMDEPPKAELPPPQPTPSREHPAKPSAVSLWHKIFGSPAEQTAKLTESPTDDPVASESQYTRPEFPGDVSTPSVRSVSDHDAPAAEFDDEPIPGAGSSLAEDEPAPDERKRGRPRRRRRGGRGRRPDERQGDGRPPAPRKQQESRGADEFDVEFDDLTDDIGDLGEDDAAESAPLDSDTDVDDTDVELGAGRATRTKSAAQRAIPSWDEAIGFIVDANMQSRSQRRPPSRSDSRGNASRGRPRGRRKK